MANDIGLYIFIKYLLSRSGVRNVQTRWPNKVAQIQGPRAVKRVLGSAMHDRVNDVRAELQIHF